MREHLKLISFFLLMYSIGFHVLIIDEWIYYSQTSKIVLLLANKVFIFAAALGGEAVKERSNYTVKVIKKRSLKIIRLYLFRVIRLYSFHL